MLPPLPVYRRRRGRAGSGFTRRDFRARGTINLDMAPEDHATHEPIRDAEQRFWPVFAVLKEAVSYGVFPGCAFGVIDGSGEVFTGAAGRQTYAADSPVVEPTTAYDLASVTKVVATTAMAMLLWQRGLLELDAPVVRWLPAFQSGDAARTAVTVRHLLTHSSGLAGYARLFETCATPETLFDACLAMPLETAPGTRAEYSDIGFILLGRLLEVIAGEPIDIFCQREIFLPLGMTTAGFNPAIARRSAIPPTEDDEVFRHRVIQGEVQDENCWVLGGISGHAGLFGQVDDVLRLARAVLWSDSRSILTVDTVNCFAQRANLPPGSSRALGWDTPSQPSSSGSLFSARSIGHLGYAGTSLWIDLADRCAVVLLSNRTWPTRENQRIKELRPKFHDAVRQCLVGSSTS
jgi:CubicO group peptidase (beta-lactamase class C family)